MRVVYTKHAKEKLLHPDIKKFGISKSLILRILKNPQYRSRTKYQNYAAMSQITESH